MDNGQANRGRSPSAGHKNPRVASPSVSPHTYHDAVDGIGLDPSVSSTTFTTGAFNTSNNLMRNQAGSPYNFSTPYLEAQNQSSHNINNFYAPSEQTFDPTQFKNQPQDNQFPEFFLPNQEYQQFSTMGANDFNMNQGQAFDGSYYDESLQNDSSNQSINPADLSRISSPSQNHTTPPNLLQPENHSSPGAHSSPASHQGPFFTPGHSRHTSLDPSSAAFPQGVPQGDWTGMLGNAAFQGHRRAPSEHSDVSSSVAPSPFLAQHDTFEAVEGNHSPLLNANDDPSFTNSLGIESFTLAENEFSPARSPYVSPQMLPDQHQHQHQHQHQGLGQDSAFALSQNQFPQFNDGGPGPEIYNQHLGSSPHVNLQRAGSNELGQADSMAPPEINVEFAPPSRVPSFGPPRGRAESVGETLIPPTRSKL